MYEENVPKILFFNTLLCKCLKYFSDIWYYFKQSYSKKSECYLS